jgi:hypothetical protein
VNVSGSHLQEGAFGVEKKQEQPEQKKQEPKKQTPAVGARPQKKPQDMDTQEYCHLVNLASTRDPYLDNIDKLDA